MPPKNKKIKVKMTKAERKAMKAIKKKLALIRINEDRMNREHKMTLANLPKVVHMHYPKMKEATILQMKQDLKVMEKICNRVFDLKRNTVETLQEDIDSAEATYMRQTRAHLNHLDRLIGIMQEQIKGLSEIYNEERTYFYEKALKTKDQLTNTFMYEQEILKTAIYLKGKEHKEREANATGEFFLKFEDMIEKLQSQHDKMEGYFESEVLKMWQSMQNYFYECQHKMAERRQAYDYLLRLDMENSSCIRHQANRIHSMLNQIETLKDKLNISEDKYEKEIGDLKSERQEYITLYKNLRTSSTQKSMESTLLKNLVFCCNETEKKLGRTKDKAEKVLILAQMCRVLETEEEKVVACKNEELNQLQMDRTLVAPFYINEKMQFIRHRGGEKGSQEENFLTDMKTLQCFWARVGRATMLRGELMIKKQILIKENEMLKDKLREFLLILGRQNYCKCEIDQLVKVHVLK